MLPGPLEAKLSLPGCAFAIATSSWNVFTGSDSGTTSNSGTVATNVIGVRSLVESYGSFSTRLALMAMAPALQIPIV